MSEILNKANQILTEKQTKILPENIKKGITIFDVEGILEDSGTEINNQDKTITENGTYTADEGYTGLGSVEVNIPQAVQIFNTQDEMNTFLRTNYDELSVGNNAVVYGEEQVVPIGNEQLVQSFYFPETIILTEPLTRDIQWYQGSKYSNGGGGGTRSITPESFTAMWSLNMNRCNIKYESTDGQTYVRTTATVSSSGGSNSYGKFEWDEATSVLSITGSTTSFCFYRAVNGGHDVLAQFFRQIKPVFDGIFEVVNTNDYMVRRIGVPATAYINGTMPTEAEYVYVGTEDHSSSYNMYGIKSGTINYMGVECVTFSRVIQYKSSTVGILRDTSSSKLVVGTWTSVNTANYGATERTSTYYEVENGAWVEKTAVIIPNTAKYKYVSGNYTYYFTPFMEVALNEADTLYCLHSYSSSYYFANGYVSGGSTTHSRPTTYSLYLPTIKYDRAPNQMTIDNVNQLLPGRTAYGVDGSYTGDGSLYNNLDTYNVNANIFNLTEDDRSSYTYYGVNPTQYVCDITDKTKMYFLKQGDLTQTSNHYIGKVQYDNIEHMTPTLVYSTIQGWVYNKKRNMIISRQYLSTTTDGTTTYIYHVVFENALTHEILNDVTATNPAGSGYYYMAVSDNAVYLYDQGTYNSTTKYFKVITYNLDTFTMTTLMNKTTTYDYDYDYGFGLQIVDNRYCFMYCSWQLGTSTCYYYSYVYDDISKTNKTLINGTTATTAGSSFSNVPELVTLDCGDVIYFVCSWGYFDDRVYLYKLTSTDNSFTVSTLRNTTSANVDGYDLANVKGIDLDSNLLFWGGNYLSKSDSTVGGYLYYNITDEDGNIILEKGSISGMFSLGESNYVYTTTYVYKMKSYSLSGTIAGGSGDSFMNIIIDTAYRMPVSQTITYIDPTNTTSQIVQYGVSMDHDTFVINDNKTYDVNFTSEKLFGSIQFTPCIENTSLDFDYSVLYGGYDHLIQRNVQCLDATITPTEYTEAIETVNEILGEEV